MLFRSVISALRLEQLKIPPDFNLVPQSLLDNMAAVRAQGDIKKRIDRESESLNEMTEELHTMISGAKETLYQLRQVSPLFSERVCFCGYYNFGLFLTGSFGEEPADGTG